MSTFEFNEHNSNQVHTILKPHKKCESIIFPMQNYTNFFAKIYTSIMFLASAVPAPMSENFVQHHWKHWQLWQLNQHKHWVLVSVLLKKQSFQVIPLFLFYWTSCISSGSFLVALLESLTAVTSMQHLQGSIHKAASLEPLVEMKSTAQSRQHCR